MKKNHIVLEGTINTLCGRLRSSFKFYIISPPYMLIAQECKPWSGSRYVHMCKSCVRIAYNG